MTPEQYTPTRLRRLSRIVSAERRVTDAVAVALQDLADRALEQLTADGFTTTVLDNRAEEWRTALADTIMPVVADVYEQGFRAELRTPALSAAVMPGGEAVPGDFGAADHLATRYLADVHNRMVGVADDVFRVIASSLEEGRQATFTLADGSTVVGESIPELGKRVEAALTDGQRWRNRGVTVARTEVIGANNAGSHAAAYLNAELFGASSTAVVKEWLNTHDPRTRETHAAAGGQTVLGMDTPFQVGGASLQQPGDPSGPAGEVINCRCTALYHYPGDPEYAAKAEQTGAAVPEPTLPEAVPPSTPAAAGPGQGTWETLSGASARRHAEQFVGPRGAESVRTVHRRGQHTVITETDLTPAQVTKLLDETGPVLDAAAPLLGETEILIRVPEVSSDQIFRRSSGTLGYVTQGINTVNLSPAMVAESPSLLRGIDSALQGGHFMPAAADVSHIRYTFAHELGHVIDFLHAHTQGMGSDTKAAGQVFRKAKAAKVLSRYGRSSRTEAYAEAFADWLLAGDSTATAYKQEYGWHSH